MNHSVRCRCGWEGSLEGLPEGRCPRCAAQLPKSLAPGEPHGTDANGRSAPEAGAGPNSARPAVLPAPAGDDLNRLNKGAVAKTAASVLGRVWNYLRSAAWFYVEKRSAILAGWRVWINEHLPSLDRPDAIRREIRIHLEEQDGVRDEAGVWHVDLPPRCVVCGGKATGGWISETRTVLDPYGPIVGPLAGLIFGIYLSWWYQSHLWMFGSLALGGVVGFAARKNVQFAVRFMRCSKHPDSGRIPELIVLHQHLVIRVGSREVKLAFLQRGRDVGTMDEIPLPREIIVAPPTEMISLAEEVHPGASIVPDQAARLAAADDDNNPAGPDEYRLSR